MVTWFAALPLSQRRRARKAARARKKPRSRQCQNAVRGLSLTHKYFVPYDYGPSAPRLRGDGSRVAAAAEHPTPPTPRWTSAGSGRRCGKPPAVHEMFMRREGNPAFPDTQTFRPTQLWQCLTLAKRATPVRRWGRESRQPPSAQPLRLHAGPGHPPERRHGKSPIVLETECSASGGRPCPTRDTR